MKHFGIYADAEELQDALDAGTLENDYVALVNGYLDYNSLSPEEPCYLGEWSDGSDFTILDTGSSEWDGGVTIGQLQGVYVSDTLTDLDINLSYSDGYWTMEFFNPDESDQPTYDFEEGVPYNWESRVMTERSVSDSSISVYYDGVDIFEFHMDDSFLSTENPECPEEGPIE